MGIYARTPPNCSQLLMPWFHRIKCFKSARPVPKNPKKKGLHGFAWPKAYDLLILLLFVIPIHLWKSLFRKAWPRMIMLELVPRVRQVKHLFRSFQKPPMPQPKFAHHRDSSRKMSMPALDCLTPPQKLSHHRDSALKRLTLRLAHHRDLAMMKSTLQLAHHRDLAMMKLTLQLAHHRDLAMMMSTQPAQDCLRSPQLHHLAILWWSGYSKT